MIIEGSLPNHRRTWVSKAILKGNTDQQPANKTTARPATYTERRCQYEHPKLHRTVIHKTN